MIGDSPGGVPVIVPSLTQSPIALIVWWHVNVASSPGFSSVVPPAIPSQLMSVRSPNDSIVLPVFLTTSS